MGIKRNRSNSTHIDLLFLLPELESESRGEKVIIDNFKATFLGQVIGCLADYKTKGALLQNCVGSENRVFGSRNAANSAISAGGAINNTSLKLLSIISFCYELELNVR
jgi:hypothetical protein